MLPLFNSQYEFICGEVFIEGVFIEGVFIEMVESVLETPQFLIPGAQKSGTCHRQIPKTFARSGEKSDITPFNLKDNDLWKRCQDTIFRLRFMSRRQLSPGVSHSTFLRWLTRSDAALSTNHLLQFSRC